MSDTDAGGGSDVFVRSGDPFRSDGLTDGPWNILCFLGCCTFRLSAERKAGLNRAHMNRFFIMLAAVCSACFASGQTKSSPEYLNFYGISWMGKTHDHLTFARQMGYSAVFYITKMEMDTLSNGLGFYLETPEYFIYKRVVNRKQKYAAKDLDFYSRYCAVKDSTASFPDNLATGWIFNDSTFSAQLDFQQKEVVTWAVDQILTYVKQIRERNPRFAFAGYAWDVPQPGGDFWSGHNKGHGSQVTLTYWGGKDSGRVKQGTASGRYASYSEGRLEFYKELFRRTRELYPAARFIMEPYKIYDDWVRYVENRPDARQIMPDLVSQEMVGDAFVKDQRIYQKGLLTPHAIACSTPSVFSEKGNRELAAAAAIQGSWFCWYGRYGGSGDMPNFQSILQVPARLQLIRVLTLWENVNQTPLSKRKWDGSTYRSPTAFIDSTLIAARQPITRKTFFVCLSPDTHIPVTSRKFRIYRTDNLFRETDAAESDFESRGSYLVLKNPDMAGKGYILVEGTVSF